MKDTESCTATIDELHNHHIITPPRIKRRNGKTKCYIESDMSEEEIKRMYSANPGVHFIHKIILK